MRCIEFRRFNVTMEIVINTVHIIHKYAIDVHVLGNKHS